MREVYELQEVEIDGQAGFTYARINGMFIPLPPDEKDLAPIIEHTAARLRAWGIQTPKAELMAADLVATVLRVAAEGAEE